MTALERIRRARRLLATAIAAAALLWGAAAAALVIVLAAVTRLLVPLPAVVRLSIVPLAVLGALAGIAIVLWRGRAARSAERVALWIEEREPSLRFALVTAIDPRLAPPAEHPDLHAAAGAAHIEAIVRRATARTTGIALLAAVIALGALVPLHPRDLLDGRGLYARIRGTRAAAPLGNRLTPLTARIEPPAYARMRAESVAEPSDILALIGSRVTLAGGGPPDGVTAVLGADTLAAGGRDDGWAIAMPMPREPVVAALHDRAYRRLVTLEPRADSAPDVKLRLPANDTTYQTVPTGSIAVEASIGDDIGLAFGYVEYLLSTGSEETFETKMTTSRRVAFGNARSATLRDVVRFDTLHLAPGSVLHIRVVAYDFNDVTGPGKGVSETRTLRVAEKVDSVSIAAAPPLPIDSMWVSQRLLNMRTDTLVRGERRMARTTVVDKSTVYGNSQETIRQKVLAVIAILEDNGVGGSFETETSTKLREVADMMWSARTDLGIAQPDTALPTMRKILKILDELRLAHRYYLRGLLKPVPVNIERVRLSGKDSAAVAARTPRDALSDPAAALLARLDALAAMDRLPSAAAVESLTYVRVAALTSAPAAATALKTAMAAIERGSSLSAAIAPARRALAPRPHMVASPPEWAGVAP